MLAGIKTTQVPYRGLSPAINDLIAGHVDLMFDTPTTSLPLHRDGKVKIIATGTPERLPEASDIPTIAESGVSGYRAITWYALVGPPNMAAPLVTRINRDVAEILSRAEVAERVRAIQMEPSVRTPEQSAAFFADESELWGKVIKQANIPLQ
jgi:tripartite-type tricarboxylate transporter receptor subunit TctC